MRKTLLSFTALAACLGASPAAFAQGSPSIIDMPFILGVMTIMAPRCGLRDTLWASRLVGTAEVAIQHLNYSVVTPQTGATEDMLLDRLSEGQQSAISTLANDPGACAKLTPDRLAKIDRIVTGATPVF